MVHLFKNLIELGLLVYGYYTVWEGTDRFVKQYKCDITIYLMTVLSKLGYLEETIFSIRQKWIVYASYFPRIWPKVKSWIIRDKERQSENRINGCCHHVPFNKTCDNKECGKVLQKWTYCINQEYNQSLIGAHQLWDELHLDLLQLGVLWIPWWWEEITRISY